jgi:hypothetical protein
MNQLLMNIRTSQKLNSLSRPKCPSQSLNQKSRLEQPMNKRSREIRSSLDVIPIGIVILQIGSKLMLKVFETAVVHDPNPVRDST